MDLKNWTASLADKDKLLNTLVFPGTHDSGMSHGNWHIGGASYISHGFTSIFTGIAAYADDLVHTGHRSLTAGHDNYLTQYVNVRGQLDVGARQFDTRMKDCDGVYRAFHGPKALRVWGETWPSICEGIASFMKETDGTEFIILKLDKQKVDDFSMIKELLTALERHDYNPIDIEANPNDQFIDQWPIKAVQGKIFICTESEVDDVWRNIVLRSQCLVFCQWEKISNAKSGFKVDKAKYPNRGGKRYFILIGDSNAGQGESSLTPLKKQIVMKNAFPNNRGIGMRGIWFNTWSMLRDIQTWSEKIWDDAHLEKRKAIWIENVELRQNVASVDFIDETRAREILSYNSGLQGK